MRYPHVTHQPAGRDELAWHQAQHRLDGEALQLAADIIAFQEARIIALETEQATLILLARREAMH